MAHNEPVMYFVVNDSLKMGKGKIAAQVGHAAIWMYEANPRNDLFREWSGSHSAKIILKADSATMMALSEKYSHQTVLVRDEGRTQIEPNSPTVLVFRVMPKDSNQDLSALKLM